VKSLHHITEHQSTNPSDRKGTEQENLLRFSETRKLRSSKVACEQALQFALVAEREKKGELAT